MAKGRGFRKFRVIICGLLLTSEVCLARPKTQTWVSAISTVSTYQDVKLSEGEPATLDTSLDVEIGFRLHSLFSFLLVGSSSVASMRQGYGLGFRIGLPGFFFLGATRKQTYRSRRHYPVNTSMFVTTSSMSWIPDSQEEEETVLASRYGLSLDIFLFQSLTFLTAYGGLYSFGGDTFLNYGGGLGVEF